MKSPIALLTLVLAPAVSAALPEPRFRPVNIDTNIAIGYGIATGDIDGDGKPDIVLCDKKQIAWYRNPSWQKHVIAENLTPNDHVCIAVADTDGDQKAEIAVGAGWNPSDTVGSGAVFYLIPPADRTQPWEPVKLPHEPTVHRMRWVKDWQGNTTLIVVPLHGRGNKDAQGDGVKIQRYTKPANPKDSWTISTLNESWHKTHNFDPIQWDEDSAQELLVGSREGAFVLNWSRAQNGYEAIQIGSDDNGGIGEIRYGSLGASKHLAAAVSPMHGNQLVVFLPSATGDRTPWTRLVLDEALVDGHALACGDLLGQGRDQIIVGWRAMGKPATVKVGIKMYVGTDTGGKEWKPVVIDDNTMACEDLCLADLNGDGRLDIVAAGRATRNVKVYFNESR